MSTILLCLLFNAGALWVFQKNLPIPGGAVFVLLCIAEYLVWAFIFKRQESINGRIFDDKAWVMGSYPNYYEQTEGNRWTASQRVKEIMSKGELFLDQFRFDRSVLYRLSPVYGFASKFNDFDCYADPVDFTQSGIIFGGMGSGKTEFYHSIIAQDKFDRVVAYDTKGDLVQKHYSVLKDIILNPYDQRSHIWNPFEEAKTSPFVTEIFLTNLFNALSGTQKDFFSASSKQRYMKLFNDILYNNSELSSNEQFDLFIQQLKEYFKENQDHERRSEADVASTMHLTFEFFDYMNFCIQNGSPTFTIKEYLSRKSCKLFLLSRDDQRSKLTPFFTGFLAAMTAVMLSQEDQKTSLTLFALDEYLSFAQNLDSETIEGLHTRIRSKGGCLLPGVQYFPEQSNKADSAQGITQKMLNSAAYWFLFQGVDEYTLKKINNTIGKVRYRKEQIREQLVADPLNRKNYQIEESDLLNTSLFQSLGQNYEHITFVPSKRILYKGYTPRAELPNKKANYVQSENIEKYYREVRV